MKKLNGIIFTTALLFSSPSMAFFDFFNEWSKFNAFNRKMLSQTNHDEQNNDSFGDIFKDIDTPNDQSSRSNQKPTTQLSDIKGGVPQEILDLVDILNRREHFDNVGAQLPTGYLLVGPPGTGKTTIARALATELNAPFFYASGSEFIEMYVGVGAQRVRELFSQARASLKSGDAQNAIIFIDEIDALGNRAGTRSSDTETRRTINELLTQMDGFASDHRIIVIAATNEVDLIDSALLRPGRFEYAIEVPLPGFKARKAILDYYLRDPKHNRTVDSTVNIRAIAQITGGLSGADLKSLANTAAIAVARDGRTVITQDDLESAVEKIGGKR